MQLEKTYNPAAIEDKLYQKWLDNKYFHAEVDRSKKPFTIVIPPPRIHLKTLYEDFSLSAFLHKDSILLLPVI